MTHDAVTSPPIRPLDLVVLTSSPVGLDVAAALSALPEVRSIAVATSPVDRGRKPYLQKLRDIHRFNGWPGLRDAALHRLRQPRLDGTLADLARARCPAARHLSAADFHDPSFLEQLRALAPDLGIVFATYVLRPAVFTMPRLGSVNVHFGRAPEFRGSSPGFYEMLQGVSEVGVTVHRVTDTLDGGHILVQECCPLDVAPPGDPIDYLARYQREVLAPLGTRLLVEIVRRLARGDVDEWPQDTTKARTYRRATYALKQELRRVVAERRRAAPHAVS